MTMPAWICVATPGFIRLITIAPTRIAAGGMWPTRPPKAAPILLLVRDAAGSDPELRAVLEELDADRLRRMTDDNARRLHAAGHLRPGVTLIHAADVLWTYSSAELYELLVLRRGMPPKNYGQFVADAMIDALLS
jgi:hypothetical protein